MDVDDARGLLAFLLVSGVVAFRYPWFKSGFELAFYGIVPDRWGYISLCIYSLVGMISNSSS
ncbi:hypothetical protein BDV38DRAFT_234832 [Aspergillus pseudotamarii]|uniref:Uncharacterized protein n=1 Tax=Aspergillus pseudotamarii TaxID=132259 RepID=A0A5N6T7U8_ASPPS|nr:uncharacterized protein BDV38DRAFT_234832 [Aspergillus pseudotamarii]KAE8142454.1 hypothetical protein BDV38DRAFT_234832 [Aspergillus pseudotamarii]